MNEKEKIEQARYIATTGRVIWERIIQIQTEQLSQPHRADACRDMSLHQFNTTLLVSRHQPVSITQLSHLLGVSPPSASNMVERLVEKGVLVREPSPEDRRKVVVSVSPAALGEFRKVEASVLGLFVDLVDRIGPETSRKWCEVLAAVRDAVETQVQAPGS
jgi:DNA-binding MarR family transcriptional regulator